MNLKVFFSFFTAFALISFTTLAREYHVSIKGSDDNNGSVEHPFRTISFAGKIARAGDTITVHAGTYREWINPSFSGTSRLTFKAMQKAGRSDPKIAARVNFFEHRVPEEFYDFKKYPGALNNLISDPQYENEIDHMRCMLKEQMKKTNDLANSEAIFCK